MPPLANAPSSKPVEYFDDYWLEYYRPSTLSSFPKMFAYKMNSTIKYIPIKSTQDGRYDLSPFHVRIDNDVDADKKKVKRPSSSNAPGSPSSVQTDDGASIKSDKTANRGMSLQRWLQPAQDKTTRLGTVMQANSDVDGPSRKAKPTALEKSKAAQWTFTKAVHDSLNPSIQQQEADDYARYIHHPQDLPLVVSSDTPADVDSSEYQEYVNGMWQENGLMEEGTEEEVNMYLELLKVGENPLTVTEEDAPKKRYKAYRKWLRGKSFFKQQPLD